jgi:two-component system NtrC family response regulator
MQGTYSERSYVGMPKNKILVVDDEEGIRSQLKWTFTKDYDVFLASDVDSAKKTVEHEKPDLVMLDISLTPDIGDGTEGISILQYILGLNNTTKVIMVTGNDTRENALKCVAMGAYDFYSKPIDLEEVKVSIKRALYIQNLERENQQLRDDLEGSNESRDIISDCKQMDEILDIVRRVSTTDVTILIQGESGTGKELIAKAIHFNSSRKDKPFIPINCGAIPENLLESELFGHEKGAFTDAHTQKKGKFELAQNGTIFLDEIAELSLTLQVKILRFLQDMKIERIGGKEIIPLDVRVIAATNKNIQEEMKEGKFRDDLYYRLNVISIFLPPLRDRGDDVIILANTFLKRLIRSMKSNIIGFSNEAISALRNYDWPGNIRELENKVKRAMIMAKSQYIMPEDLDILSPEVAPIVQKQSQKLPLKEARDRLETQYIKEYLNRNSGNVSRASEQIGITRSTFYSLIEKYNIEMDKWK